MCRPTKLTLELQESIVNLIAEGNYQETAAACSGIDESTFYNWMKRGKAEKEKLDEGGKPRKSETIFLEFFKVIKKALAESEVRDIAVIDNAAQGGILVAKKTVTKRTESKNGAVTEMTIEEESYMPPQWQASAWRLERKQPDKFGKKDKHELTGKDGKPIEIKNVFDELCGLEGTPSEQSE